MPCCSWSFFPNISGLTLHQWSSKNVKIVASFEIKKYWINFVVRARLCVRSLEETEEGTCKKNAKERKENICLTIPDDKKVVFKPQNEFRLLSRWCMHYREFLKRISTILRPLKIWRCMSIHFSLNFSSPWWRLVLSSRNIGQINL